MAAPLDLYLRLREIGKRKGGGFRSKKGKEPVRVAFQDVDSEEVDDAERRLLKPFDGATTSTSSSAQYQKNLVEVAMAMNTDFEEEKLIRSYIDGFALPDPISIGSPIRFSITGFKHPGAGKVKTIDVLAHFIPEHLRNKEVTTTVINQSQKSIDDYRMIGNFDLTKVKPEEELPYIRLMHPCTCCNLGPQNCGHFGVLKVFINAIFSRLLNKQEFFEYQINCGSTETTIGSVIFFKLKKPETGLKRFLLKVHKIVKEVGPYIAPVLGIVGLVVK